MDPTLANADLAPPQLPVLVRGLLPALLAHAVLAAALTSGVQWKRTPDASKFVAVPGLNDVAPAGPGITGVSPQAAVPAMDSATPAAAPQAAVAPDPPSSPSSPATASEPPERVAMGAAAAPPASERSGPSFDCDRARSRPERIICADEELSRLDRDLGRLYARARASATDAADFRRENEAQWRLRESSCRDRECLVGWYAQRRNQLLARLEGTGAAQSR